MEYEKQQWQIGDTVTAEKLNHMEDGIANVGITVCLLSKDEVDGRYMTAENHDQLDDKTKASALIATIFSNADVMFTRCIVGQVVDHYVSLPILLQLGETNRLIYYYVVVNNTPNQAGNYGFTLSQIMSEVIVNNL